MIAAVMYFLLGLLTTAFVVLAVAPAIWRRAVRLTEKRIEATLPLSREEIRAEKDAVRADAAMAARRLEIAKSKTEGKAATLEADLNREREKVKELTADRDEKSADIAELRSLLEEARQEIETLGQENGVLVENLEKAETEIEDQLAELTTLGRDLSEAAVNISSHEVELATRETELARRAEETRGLRENLRAEQNSARELKSDLKLMQSELKASRHHSEELDNKLEKLTAANAETEERLSRRDGEIKRLNGELKELKREAASLDRKLAAAVKKNTKLETQAVRLKERIDESRADGGPDALKKSVSRLEGARDRMRDEIASLKKENTELARKLATAQKASRKSGNGKTASGKGDDDTALREQISEIAARVVYMTAMLEGEDSPIEEALAKPVRKKKAPAGGQSGQIISLAERIRILQGKEAVR